MSSIEDGAAEEIVVRDGGGRRRFMRSGAALLLAGGGAAVMARPVLADDCDRAAYGGGDAKAPKQAISGSDSDAGEGADPAGCGRRREDPPAISRATPPAAPEGGMPRVEKVRA